MEASDVNFEKKFQDLKLEHPHVLEDIRRAKAAKSVLKELDPKLDRENKILKRTIELLQMQRNELLSENKRLRIKLNEPAPSKQVSETELQLVESQKKSCAENLKLIQEFLLKSIEELETFSDVYEQMG